MAALDILESPRDLIERRLMVALEFIDPVTGRVVSEGLHPSVEDFPSVMLTRSGRFAWLLDGPPVTPAVDVRLNIRNPMYGPPAAPLFFQVKPNDGVTRPEALLESFALTTTVHYRPPDGMVCVVGTLIEGGGSTAAKPGMKVSIEVTHDKGTGIFVSTHAAVTDATGAFAAVLQGVTNEKPDPVPAGLPGAIKAELVIEEPGDVRRRAVTPAIRLGRVTYLTEKIKWDP